jgi:hypothetical protein
MRVDAADFVVFDSKASFLAATGAQSATGPIPNLGKVANTGGQVALGSVTFAVPSPSVDLWLGEGGGVDWTPLLAGNELAIGGSENLNAGFAAPVYSAGFEFAEPACSGGCGPSTFDITLKKLGQTVAAFSYQPLQNVGTFWGVGGTTQFDLIQIREAAPADIADEHFGQFYTSTTPVPEPSTVCGLAAGLFIAISVMIRRNRNAVRAMKIPQRLRMMIQS